MNRNDRIVRIARDLRQLIREETDTKRLKDYEKVALAISDLLNELSDTGTIGQDVSLELHEYASLKTDNVQVAEQYGDSVDIGLDQYKSSDTGSKD